MTPMTSGPLQTLFNVKEPKLSLRKAMHERLEELGISNPQVLVNLIGNAAGAIETQLYIGSLRNPPQLPRILLSELRDKYTTESAAKPADFSPEALTHYQNAFLQHAMDDRAFGTEYALVADLRAHGCNAALSQLQQTLPQDSRAPGRPSRVPARSL